jgi:hypothetical protein
MSVIESPLIQAIPGPDAVRNRLAQLAHEQALLRGLLRLSQRKEQVRNHAANRQREAAR